MTEPPALGSGHLVVGPPQQGPGAWAGAPSAVWADGRATAGQNDEERTGLASGRLGADGRLGLLRAVDGDPLTSPHAGGGRRCPAPVTLPEGRTRCSYERTRADGAHELRTELHG